MRDTSRDYRRPHRPPLVRLYHRLAPAGAARFTAGALIDGARRRSGLRQFDDEAFVAPLERLCAALEEEARLTPTGRLLTRARIESALINRLRLAACYAAHPEIADIAIEAPLFVTGLQRSGTTKLQRMLAADPDTRALSSWEALHPAPWPQRLPFEPRRLAAHAAEATLRYLAPDFFAVHPVEAGAPEEEVVLLDHSFASTVSEASYHVPSFARWLESYDHTPAYAYLSRALRLLSWQRRQPKRWVLKTPHHLEHLPLVARVFPGARVVQTHRDPRVTVASFCSMVAHGRGIFSDAVDPHEVGRHWLRKIRRMLDRAMDARDGGEAPPVLDVRYDELLDDPMRAIARVYDFAERPLTGAARRAMHAWLSRNPQHQHGRHRYALADFGLDEARVAEATQRYVVRFGSAW